MTITSRDNERVKEAVKLAASAAFRREKALFFAEGARLCLDLAQSLAPHTLFYTARALLAHPALEALPGEHFTVSPPVAEKLAATRATQGVFGLFPLPGSALAAMSPARGLLLCEALQDPSNVGALVRSAAAFGLGGVVLGPGCADPFSPKALRASAGAAARIPLAVDCPLEDAAALLAEQGGCLLAAALDGAQPLSPGGAPLSPGGAPLSPGAAPLSREGVSGPWGLLVGNEGAGLSPAALALANRRVYIPMERGVESLNAAVAGSVLLYALRMQGNPP